MLSQPAVDRMQSFAYGGLVLALLWAPWPLGSNRNWALGLLAAWIWLLVVVACLARALDTKSSRAFPLTPSGWMPLTLLATFAALSFAQQWAGPSATGLLVSLDPFQTRRYGLTTLLYLGAWILVGLTCATTQRATRLLGWVITAGLLQAVAAVLLYAAGDKYTLFQMPFEQGERAMGTFPNPDHLAGYMELCLSAGVGWLLSQMWGDGEQKQQGWRGWAVALLSFMMSPKMLVRLLLLALVVALVMTHSRMGNVAFFASLLIAGCLIALLSARLRRPALWLVASMVVVDIFVVGQWVGLDRVAQRLEDTVQAGSVSKSAVSGLEGGTPPREESLEKRLQVPRLSLALVADRPWLGHGGGTYATAFPPYKVDGLPWYWDHAHNDYIQVASDMGLVGLFLWLGIGVASGVRSLRLLHEGQTPISQGLAAAALLALCSLALHTIVDFNLHIPANALTITVLLAGVWAVPTSRGRRRRSAAAKD